MAKPPEPLAEVLDAAELVVEATVVEVLSEGVKPPQPPRVPGTVGSGVVAPAQELVLGSIRVLRGVHRGDTLRVSKPPGPYVVDEGTTGAWLLDGSVPVPVILGRYGPFSWRLQDVEVAVQRRR